MHTQTPDNAVLGISMTKDFSAPKLGSDPVEFKSFKVTEIVEAQHYRQGDASNYVDVYKTLDGYLIPQESAINMGVLRLEEPEQIQEPMQEAVEVEAPIQESPTPSAIVSDVTKRNKASINGALAGAGIGMITAMLTQKNKAVFTIIGTVAGYAISQMVLKQKKNDN